MKKSMLFLALVAVFAGFVSCSKDDEPENNLIQTPQAKVEFDHSNFGLYKGVFVGSSGIIIIDLNNSDAISAMLKIDGKTYNFTTAQTVEKNEKASIKFVNGNDSFVFHVSADGATTDISDVKISGHAGAIMVVEKETSTQLVECFEGSYSGDEKGTFNAVLKDNSRIVAVVEESYFGFIYVAVGTLSNNQIDISGNVSIGAQFKGERDGNTINGIWNNIEDEDYDGTWSGKRTY